MMRFLCQENGCEKTFKNLHNMKRHLVTKHLRTKIFKCEVCEKELSSMQNLREHQSMHQGIKTYQCETCGGKFRYCSQLSNHRKLHRREEDLKFVELKLTDLMKSCGFELRDSLKDD